MERELLLTVKSAHVSQDFIDAEKRNMSRIFPYIESFRAFILTNEVFNVRRCKCITRTSQLLKAYHRLIPEPFNFIISKN